MAQPFPRAWDILKQGPFDRPFTHEEVVARNQALPPMGQMVTPKLHPQDAAYTQQPMGNEVQNRINALHMQIAALQQELEMLVTMQSQYGPPQSQFSPGAFY